ncbi:hypothetical protein BGZ61DRAFT_441804 [Ilyonectria robusta]|uniref:uncharacterized protein n=1 Tax=Ilyonectria robusta TaxID=1079257 RepID=UPI001E8CA0B7|nr:uncharacterized protein BGZ61DRAFT_441804 [Ilyonectria robusta]KAH8736309.1 hypothetical protein BGZ61DRAFT_441804 [Ilyonectria robusta]
MEYSNTVASWVGVGATAIGLASLVTQGTLIQERLDPYYDLRDKEFLGPWVTVQYAQGWCQFWKPSLRGPVITASMSTGLCGNNTVQLTRKPHMLAGRASWTVVMGVFHPRSPGRNPSRSGSQLTTFTMSSSETCVPGSQLDYAYAKSPSQMARPEALIWSGLDLQPLIRHRSTAGVLISRTTLVTLLCISNARTIFSHCSASGYRASFPSYIGLWTIEWPIGEQALVRLSAHDMFANPASDPYPYSFEQRVDRCMEMLAGILDNRHGLCVAFPGRKAVPGRLELQHRGFAGSHGSRHLYNMSGGRAYEVDLLFRRPISQDEVAELDDPMALVLQVPSLDPGQTVPLIVPSYLCPLLAQVLDSLPWTSLSWSMHRGMRDILLAFGKSTMDGYRVELAESLKQAVLENESLLILKDWAPNMVSGNMPNIVYSSVMAGVGDSGDIVRVVTEVAKLLVTERGSALDETFFWRKPTKGTHQDGQALQSPLGSDAIVALTKFFVLEWSQEFDYQMYHNLPMHLLVV